MLFALWEQRHNLFNIKFKKARNQEDLAKKKYKVIICVFVALSAQKHMALWVGMG